MPGALFAALFLSVCLSTWSNSSSSSSSSSSDSLRQSLLSLGQSLSFLSSCILLVHAAPAPACVPDLGISSSPQSSSLKYHLCSDMGTSVATSAMNRYNLTWSQQMGTSTGDQASAIAVDVDGSIFIAGETGGLIGSNQYPGKDVFVAKISATSGSLLARTQTGSSASDKCRGMAVHAATGAVFVTGSTTGSMIGASTPSAGGQDIFVLRAHHTNTESDQLSVQGVAQFGSTDDDVAFSIAVYDPSSWTTDQERISTSAFDWSTLRVVIAGYTEGAYVDDGSSATSDMLILMLDGHMREVWSMQLIGTNSLARSVALGVAFHPSSDDIFVTGYVDGGSNRWVYADGAFRYANPLGSSTFSKFSDSFHYPFRDLERKQQQFLYRISSIRGGSRYYGFHWRPQFRWHKYIDVATSATSNEYGTAVAILPDLSGSTGALHAIIVGVQTSTGDGIPHMTWTRLNNVQSNNLGDIQLHWHNSTSSIGSDSAIATALACGHTTVVAQSESPTTCTLVGLVDGTLLGGTTLLGKSDILTVQINSMTGNLRWRSQFSTAGNDVAFAAAIDIAGNMLLAGETTGFIGYRAGTVQPPYVSSNAGGSDAFVAKFGNAIVCLAPPGKYCETPTSTTYTNCPVGSFCTGRQLAPRPCIPDSNGPQVYCPENSKDVNPCLAGYFCPNTTHQIACNQGDYCPTGSLQQQDCPLGSYCSDPSNIERCTRRGTYCGIRSVEVALCPSSYYCPTPSQQLTCNNTVGAYCPQGSFELELCPVGSFCRTPEEKTHCDLLGSYCSAGSNSSHLPCPAGSYCSDPSSIDACTPGQYCPLGSLSPRACPEGFVCETPSSIRLCAKKGEYCVGTGITNATCPRGFYCPDFRTKLPCTKVGSFCPPGSKAEELCPAGFYCSAPDVEAAQKCTQAGSYCAAGSTQISTCPAGSYCPDSSQRVTCSVGYACPARSRSPILCSAFISKPENPDEQLATYCPRGGGVVNSLCPAATYCPQANVSLACEFGSYCPEGSYSTQICPEGHVCSTPASKKSCNWDLFGRWGMYCPQGTFNGTVCPTNFFCTGATSKVACNPGKYCPAGTHSRAWVSGDSSPPNCGSGFYCPDPSTRIECPAGFVCVAGSTKPVLCPGGFACSKYSARICSSNHRYYGSAEYCPPATSIYRSYLCPAGYFCPNTTSRIRCTLGSYCRAGSSYAKACPAGFYCPEPTTRHHCANGQYCPSGSTTTQICPAGHYCSPSSLNECKYVPGYYCPAGNQHSRGYRCPEGFFCPDSRTAQQCSIGSYCPAGSPSETKCPAGFYCPDPATKHHCYYGDLCKSGSTNRSSCPPGYECPGATSTKECDAGYACPNGGRMLCGYGSFSAAGQVSCTQCPDDRPNSDYAATSEQDCRANLYPDDSSDSTLSPTELVLVFLLITFICVLLTMGMCYKCCPGCTCYQAAVVQACGWCAARCSCCCRRCRHAGLDDNDESDDRDDRSGSVRSVHRTQSRSVPHVAHLDEPELSDDEQHEPDYTKSDDTSAPVDVPDQQQQQQDNVVMHSNAFEHARGTMMDQPQSRKVIVSLIAMLCVQQYASVILSVTPLLLATYQHHQQQHYRQQQQQQRYYSARLPTAMIVTASGTVGTLLASSSLSSSGSTILCEAMTSLHADTITTTITDFDASTSVNEIQLFGSGSALYNGAPCPAGYYCSDESTIVQCTTTGSFCPEGSSQEQQCPAGSFCTQSWLIEPCENNIGPDGEVAVYCGGGSTMPTLCVARHFCPNSTTMLPCPAGFTCPLGSPQPVPCNAEPGMYCASASVAPSPCPLGSYCPDSVVAIACSRTGAYCPPKSYEELLCPGNSYCPDASTIVACGVDVTRTQGTYCPPGSVAELSCPAGSYCPTMTTKYSCPVGTYCPKLSVQPLPCPSGYFCNDLSVAPQVCNGGTYCPLSSGTPQLCPEGHYCPSPSSSPMFCNASIGTYCSMKRVVGLDDFVSDRATETLCPAGYFCHNSTSAQPCPSGTLCPEGSRIAAPCPAGYWCVSPEVPKQECVLGDLCPEGSATPQSCPAGYRCRSPVVIEECSGREPVFLCPPRTFDNGTICPLGSFCPNSTTSIECKQGQYCPAGSALGLRCPAGYFCPSASQKLECVLGDTCPPGTIQNATCPAGFMCSTPSSISVCRAGSQCPNGTTTFIKCPDNTYSSAGQANCTQCPPGLETDTFYIGATSVEDCHVPYIPSTRRDAAAQIVFALIMSFSIIVMLCSACCICRFKCCPIFQCCCCVCCDHWMKQPQALQPQLQSTTTTTTSSETGTDADTAPKAPDRGHEDIELDVIDAQVSNEDGSTSGPSSHPDQSLTSPQ
jgi:hypothetical protein